MFEQMDTMIMAPGEMEQIIEEHNKPKKSYVGILFGILFLVYIIAVVVDL